MDASKYMDYHTDEKHPCWRFAEHVYGQEFGIALPTFPVTHHKTIHWSSVAPGAEIPGDLIVIRTGNMKRHVGICVGSGKMLHYAKGMLGPVVERYTGRTWGSFKKMIYRHDG